MKINATQNLEVEISAYEIKRIMIKHVRSMGGWNEDHYIDMEAKPAPALMCRETFHTSHSWTENIFVRTATKLDLAINTILQNL